jgi:hypothetical protein
MTKQVALSLLITLEMFILLKIKCYDIMTPHVRKIPTKAKVYLLINPAQMLFDLTLSFIKL